MTTKQQEREALELIRRTIETLGADSYVATALEGCLDIAEENIECDMACSMKQRWESAQTDLVSSVEEKRKLGKKIEEQETEICIYERRIEEAERVNANLRSSLADTTGTMRGLQADLEAETAKVAKLEQQIIELKAKLYDYMVAR